MPEEPVLPEYIDEPVDGFPDNNPTSPPPQPEAPVEEQTHTELMPLDDIEDAKWLDEDDPRRKAAERWQAEQKKES